MSDPAQPPQSESWSFSGRFGGDPSPIVCPCGRCQPPLCLARQPFSAAAASDTRTAPSVQTAARYGVRRPSAGHGRPGSPSARARRSRTEGWAASRPPSGAGGDEDAERRHRNKAASRRYFHRQTHSVTSRQIVYLVPASFSPLPRSSETNPHVGDVP